MAKSNTLGVVRSSLEIGDSNSGGSLAPNAFMGKKAFKILKETGILITKIMESQIKIGITCSGIGITKNASDSDIPVQERRKTFELVVTQKF